MKGDYVSFRIASGRCLLGAALQILLGVALLIYGLLARDHAAMSAAAYSGAGIAVWVVLAIIFDQHRRERVEALEAEALEAGRASSVFESDTGDFRVASRRLASLYKILAPAAAILLATGLITIGIIRFLSAREIISPDTFPPPLHRGWAVAVGLGVAFIGFVYARFAAGMAKQALWANMRAGAAWSAGSALMGLAIAIAAFVDMAGPNTVARILVVAFPIALLVLGAEIVLNLIFDVYRPRRAGEVPRVAFDSRLLGFLAAPDRIAQSINEAVNYQLGFDVSSTWFYRLFSRTIGTLVALALLLLWSLSAVAVLEPHQRGLVLRFGRLVREVGPGWHWKLPWPIDRVEVPAMVTRDAKGRVHVGSRTATGVRTLDLGTPPPADDQKAILWTNEHATDEVYQIIQPARSETELTTDAASQDIAMVSVELPLHYTLSDVARYESFAPPELRDDILKLYAQREVLRFFSDKTVDEVLGGNNAAMSAALKDQVVGAYRGISGSPGGAGVDVLFVGVAGAHPAKRSAAAFERVVQAEQKREARLEDARRERIQKLTEVVGSVERADAIVEALKTLDQMREAGAAPAALRESEIAIQKLIDEAGGAAASVIASARAQRWDSHMGERGRAARYAGQIASYEASPTLFAAALYFSSLKEAMRDARVYITSDRVADLRIEFDLQDRDTGVDVFAPKGQGEE